MSQRAADLNADLTALLQRLPLQAAGASTPADATQAQVELLLGRIAALTDALRSDAAGEVPAPATRLLLADLAMVASQFRGHTTPLSQRLTDVLEQVRITLDKTAADGPIL